MNLIYHGTHIRNLKIDFNKISRYGYPAIFAATELDLAELYATYNAKKNNILNGGYVYEFKVNGDYKIIDFKNKLSYSRDFVKLINSIAGKKYPLVRITNVLDYPSKDFIRVNKSDVFVILDFNRIEKIELIKSGVIIK